MVRNMMGRLFLLLICVLVLGSSNGHAQNIKEGVADFDITYPNLPEEMKSNIDLLPKNMSIFFKNNRCRIELYTILGTTVILADYATKETFVLSEMMGKKIATRSSAEFIHQLEQENNLKNPTKFTLTKKTKKIAGFTCNSVEISTSYNGQHFNFTSYYSPELPNVTYSVTSDITSQIKGMMLEYDMLTNGVQMHIVANKVKAKSIMDEAFIVPADYEISEQIGIK